MIVVSGRGRDALDWLAGKRAGTSDVCAYQSSTVGKALDEDHPHAFPLYLSTHLRNKRCRVGRRSFGWVGSSRLSHISDLQKKELETADDQQEEVEAEHHGLTEVEGTEARRCLSTG